MTTEAIKATLPMGVANVGFMVDRLGQDCHPLQYIRELTQNSIESLSGVAGEVVWDVAWWHFEKTGVPKLAIIDTGTGMTGDEMLTYINQLSSSSHLQSYDGNYGVGAKVAAATRNHAGLLYLSWKNNKGSMIHLWRDPDTGEYGVKRFEREDGSYADWMTPDDEAKPSQMGSHGTMVVLLGNEFETNTIEPSLEAVRTGRKRWVTKYLNTRYFKLPDGVELKVREGYDAPRTDSRRNFLRNVIGMERYLQHNSEWSGSVELDGAVAHVWIYEESETRTKVGDMYVTNGHVAALYKDELYELKTGRSAISMLQQFGVIFGTSRVVIYVEPDRETEMLTSNTARTQLLIDGDVLPWSEWAAEFRTKIPAELNELMERIAAGSGVKDHQKSIRDRLHAIRHLFKVSRYRRVPNGSVEVSDEALGGSPGTRDQATAGKHRGSSGKGGRSGNLYAMYAAAGGDNGEPVDGADVMPQVRWISTKDGTRTADDLEDRAARFLADQNLLLVNSDFRVFTDMVSRWCEHYGNTAGARTAAEDIVHEWFEQALVETVLGAQALAGSAHWSSADLQKMWSEEGLTAAVLQRYHIDNSVKRALGTKLGSLKDKAS
ncbi:hypothetical protein [Lentzea sp. NPDC059081]|uniref:hypothetical protein n=1 Tax=Lentzea sp. NPDC059081 TaxID=3346719 RepID=UPI0036C029B6